MKSAWLSFLWPVLAAAAPVGTDVVGEKETELGLYLGPWADERAANLQELPLRQLQPAPEALDAEALRLGAERAEARAAERREQLHRSQ